MRSRTHVHRALLVLAVAAAAGFTLQRLLRPESFGDYGHYRADAVREIARRGPVHQGRSACASCHEEVHAAHQKDVHWGVQCEDCHGPGRTHVAFHGGDDSITPAAATMPREYSLEGCLFCHRRLVARPPGFAQIDPVEHYEFLGVVDPDTRCIECHDPHEPLFLLEGVREAWTHPAVFECDDCHREPPRTTHKTVADHPTIFVCGDCHPSVVRDFATRSHEFLRCTACHLFHPEGDHASRIYRNGNRRFCLLCHETRPFKSAELPQIVETEHIVMKAGVMRQEPETLLEEPTSCLQCHIDTIHDAELIKRLQEQER